MRIKENQDGLYLFVDIDDLLIKSSPLIQKQVNEKTGFKTDTLNMLEQTKRNCSYFRKYVINECTKAFEEKRFPDLEDFVIESVGLKRGPFLFEELTDKEKDLIYNKPIQFADAYLDVADKLLNQFMEERDTFLEIDNLPFGQKKSFNMERENNTLANFTKMLNEYVPGLKKINRFCLIEIERIVYEAKRRNTDGVLITPDYGDLVRMDSNDIIKTNSISSTSNKEYVLYEKPIETIRNCFFNSYRFYDIISNSDVFSNPSREIIDYDSIYQKSNVNYEAVYLVEKLLESGRFVGAYALSHHNGPRETRAKMRIISEILPQLGFIGLRFHEEEHNAERRKRSSKIKEVKKRLGINPKYAVLLDDSKDNCADWKKDDGQEILYKPRTDSELINGVLQRMMLERITNFNISAVLDIVDDRIANLKAVVKKKSMGVFDGK